MSIVVDISVSLDGFVAGPNQSAEHPLGEGGERLHEWAYGLRTFREMHGDSGGETGDDDDVLAEAFADNGAIVMGRNMFGGGNGNWDLAWEGWWGDDPPFGVPVFVLTHHAREPLEMKGGTTFTFVTEGIDAALEQARAAAGEKDIAIAGGARTIQQYLAAGYVDEMQVHTVPTLLGAGTRLFEDVAGVELEPTRVIESPAVVHLKYRVVK